MNTVIVQTNHNGKHLRLVHVNSKTEEKLVLETLGHDSMNADRWDQAGAIPVTGDYGEASTFTVVQLLWKALTQR